MALFAQGTLLKIGLATAATTIYQVNDIKGPKISLKTIDVTNQSSTEGWMEFIGGLLDGGTVTFDVNYEPVEGTHKNTSGGLLYYLSNRTGNASATSFTLIFPDTAGTTWTFSGFVTAFDVSAPVKGELKAAITIHITGKPTLV